MDTPQGNNLKPEDIFNNTPPNTAQGPVVPPPPPPPPPPIIKKHNAPGNIPTPPLAEEPKSKKLEDVLAEADKKVGDDKISQPPSAQPQPTQTTPPPQPPHPQKEKTVPEYKPKDMFDPQGQNATSPDSPDSKEGADIPAPGIDSTVAEGKKDMFTSKSAVVGGAKESSSPVPPLSPMPKKKSSLVKALIFTVVGIILIGGVGYIGYVFYTQRTEQSVSFTASNSAIPADEPIVPQTEKGVTAPEQTEQQATNTIFDTASWLTYSNDELGISFKYPSDYAITKDALPTIPGEAGRDTNLVLTRATGTVQLVLWAHPEGLAAFPLPPEGEFNPLSASTQYILKQENGTLAIARISYQSFSGVINADSNTIVAYTTETVGSMRFVFLYSNEADTERETVFKAILSSVKLKVDSDQDGLFDEREKELGTDPQNPDSDGDGYLDGVEVLNGYNPLGPGKLE